MNPLKLLSNAVFFSLIAAPLWAAPPKSLLEEENPSPAISVSETKAIDAAQSGLAAPAQSGFSDTLWKDIGDTRYLALLHGIARGIPAASLRNLTTRALVTTATLPDSKEDLLAERVDTLLRLGQAGYAQKLLAEVPKSYRKPRYDETQFLFKAIDNSDDKPLCDEASNHLGEKSNPFWQRWVVLCQAKAGEFDKAQLGLDLLSEQSEYSEFYQKIVQNLLTKKPVPKLPEVVYLEQAAWLIFSGQSGYLNKQAQPPLALASLLMKKDALPENWKETAKRYGLPDASLEVPNEYLPDLAYLQLPEKNATDSDRRIAFLAYGLRKALGHPISLEVEELLRPAYYRAEQVVASPSWRQQVSDAAEAGKTGTVILLLAGFFNSPLNDYTPADIAAAVSALVKCGLPADASALAREAMTAALASKH